MKIKEIKDPLSSFIKDKFHNNENRSIYSCRKLANMFFEEIGKKTNRTTVNNIIRKKLGYHFLKTTYKKMQLVLEKIKSFLLVLLK